MADKRKPRSYAPGYGLFLPKSSASGPRDCPGCEVSDASPDCAACGKPTAVVLPTTGAGPSHALTLCLRCYGVLSEWRAEAAATKRAGKRMIKKSGNNLRSYSATATA